MTTGLPDSRESIKPLIDSLPMSVKTTIGGYTNLNVEFIENPDLPFLPISTPPTIGSILNFKYEDTKGRIVLAFPGQVFLTIISTMFGVPYDKPPKEIEDWPAELLNSISTHTRETLTLQNHSFSLAFPVVLDEETLALKRASSKSRIFLPFQMESSRFFVEILL